MLILFGHHFVLYVLIIFHLHCSVVSAIPFNYSQKTMCEKSYSLVLSVTERKTSSFLFLNNSELKRSISSLYRDAHHEKDNIVQLSYIFVLCNSNETSSESDKNFIIFAY